jgi:hypothetical protein
MDPDWDPDPSLFIIDLQDGNKNKFLNQKFSCILIFEGTLKAFFKEKRQINHKRVMIKLLTKFA